MRVKTIEALKKYKYMVESAYDAIFFKDLKSRYIIANNKTLEAFGLSREEVIGKNDYELMADKEEAKINIEDDQFVFNTGKTKEIIINQMRETFKDLNSHQMRKTVVAYEPIWAIGTGKTASPEQAEEIHVFIRDLISQSYDQETADMVRIQYGGSIKPNNAEELFFMENMTVLSQ